MFLINFIESIKDKYDSLSKSHKKIAKYIIDNFEDVVFDTASQLSKRVSVSEVTVIRFAYALGFESFSEMRNAMKKNVVGGAENKHINTANVFFSRSSSDIGENYMRKQVSQLRKSYQNIDYEEFKTICDILMNKKRILIIGFMDSFGTASELLHLLDSIRSRVYFSKLLYEHTYTFDDIDEDSATLVVSFSPHYKYTKEQAEIVKKNKSTIITITDSFINPLKELSDYSLVFNLKRHAQLGSINTSPVLNFIFFMMSYLYENYKDKIDEYRKNKMRLEEYID